VTDTLPSSQEIVSAFVRDLQHVLNTSASSNWPVWRPLWLWSNTAGSTMSWKADRDYVIRAVSFAGYSASFVLSFSGMTVTQSEPASNQSLIDDVIFSYHSTGTIGPMQRFVNVPLKNQQLIKLFNGTAGGIGVLVSLEQQ